MIQILYIQKHNCVVHISLVLDVSFIRESGQSFGRGLRSEAPPDATQHEIWV